jgi:hypothetical protein
VTKKNKVLWAAGITASATLVAAVVVSQGSSDGGDSTATGSGGCQIIGEARDVHCDGVAADQKLDDFSVQTPAATTGPWRYKVVNTYIDGRDEGLQVRVCNVDDCAGPDVAARLGIVLQNHTVWVICKEDSGFNGGEPDGGTTWYKVKWPSDKPAPDVGESNREDRYSGWMFGKYLSPSGHDGEIAECDELV